MDLKEEIRKAIGGSSYDQALAYVRDDLINRLKEDYGSFLSPVIFQKIASQDVRILEEVATFIFKYIVSAAKYIHESGNFEQQPLPPGDCYYDNTDVSASIIRIMVGHSVISAFVEDLPVLGKYDLNKELLTPDKEKITEIYNMMQAEEKQKISRL